MGFDCSALLPSACLLYHRNFEPQLYFRARRLPSVSCSAMPILPTPEVLQRVIKQRAGRVNPQSQVSMDAGDDAELPEWVLFGASMTEWSFGESTQGLGWFLQKTYDSKVRVVNEGIAT